MNVSEIMTANPVTIDPQSALAAALQRMWDMHCHHLPVLSVEAHLVGILSEYDCQRYLAEEAARPANAHLSEEQLAQRVTVFEVMSTAPIVVEPDMSAHEAARLMLTNNIRSLPVMRGETLVGIVTTSDLLIAFMHITHQTDQRTVNRLFAG